MRLDAAICAAGYNTFHELLLSRVPTAFFAQSKIADDQGERIDAAVEAGACERLESLEDPVAVAGTLNSLLDLDVADSMRDSANNFLPGNNARRCAIELLSPLYGTGQLAWAQHALSPRLAKGLEQLGSSQAISDWLIPLTPKDQSANLVGQSVVHDVIEQLSDSAAAELRAVLATQGGSEDFADFESSLLGLLDQLQKLPGDQRVAISNDVLKTIVATMKKNPKPSHTAWSLWVCQIIDAICGLVADPVQLLTDRLQVLRVFPRIVDADVKTFFELFHRHAESIAIANEETHNVVRSLQLLKMANQRVTISMIEEAIENLAAEADVHE